MVNISIVDFTVYNNNFLEVAFIDGFSKFCFTNIVIMVTFSPTCSLCHKDNL